MRQTERAGGPKQEPESRLEVLMRAHGVSHDVAERYLMASDDKMGDAHKMLQASRVKMHSSFASHIIAYQCFASTITQS